MPRERPAPPDYPRDGAAVSRAYRRLPATLPPPELDARILEAARVAQPLKAPRAGLAAHGSPRLAPLALAATVLLSIAMVLAIAFGPKVRRAEDVPRVVPAAALTQGRQLYTSDPPAPRESAANWLARIAALRRAGRYADADAQYRRFLEAYPAYAERDAGW